MIFKFMILSGLCEVFDYLENFKLSNDDKLYLKEKFDFFDDKFIEYISNKEILKEVKVYSFDNLSIIIDDNDSKNNKQFLRISGPADIISLLEFPIKQFLSFPSLVATNCLRMRKVAGDEKILFEFGLRRAQGPMGAVSSSINSYLTSFDAVSNVLAGFEKNCPLSGTCAHSFIMSYQGKKTPLNDNDNNINNPEFTNLILNIFNKSLKFRKELDYDNTNISELSAFATFAAIYKNESILLVDTYNVFESGIKNSILIGLAMNSLGFKIKGIRLDSGDLVSQSIYAKKIYKEISNKFNIEWFKDLKVGASNDINENSLIKFNERKHEIDLFGIGTNLVTCQKQPFIDFKLIKKIREKEENNTNKEIILLFSGDNSENSNFIVKNKFKEYKTNKDIFTIDYQEKKSLLK